MRSGPVGIDTVRARVAGLHVLACDMRHERIARGPDGLPLHNAESESGYQRLTICPAAMRNGHLGCSHTTARLVLQRALDTLGEGTETLRDDVQVLDGEIGRLDHRRYDAESERAAAILAADSEGIAAADRAIAALVREHRELGRKVKTVRDQVLARLDAAMPKAPPRVRNREPASEGPLR